MRNFIGFQKFSRENNPQLSSAIKYLKSLDKKLQIPAMVAKAKGCEKCSHLGYNGRLAVLEVIFMDDKMKEIIRSGANEKELFSHLRANKFTTLMEDALLRVFQGETTLSEVFRVL